MFMITYIRTAILLLFISVLMQGSTLAFIPLILAFIFIFKTSRKEEFAIPALLIGTGVAGTVGLYLHIPILGKVLGVLSLYILKDSLHGLKRNIDFLIVLSFIFILCFVFYFLGPMTAVSKSKLFDVVYHGIIYVVAFNALISLSLKIRLERIALWVMWFSVCYFSFVVYFELSAVGVNILNISGVRDARAALSALFELSDEIGIGGSSISYQLIGNSAAMALLFLVCEIVIAKRRINMSLDWVLFTLLGLLLIVVSGSRQSIIILVLSLASCLLVREGIRKYFVIKGMTIGVLVTIGILVIGYIEGIPSIIKIFEGGSLSSLINRDTNFDAALELIEEKPWFGHGLGGYYIPSLGVVSGEFRFFPHNVILELWSEMGGVGMFFFLFSWFGYYFKKLKLDANKSLFNGRLQGGQLLIPLITSYFIGALMNEILVRSLAFFIFLAIYVNHIDNQDRNTND